MKSLQENKEIKIVQRTKIGPNLRQIISEDKTTRIQNSVSPSTKFWFKRVFKLAIEAIFIAWLVFTFTFIILSLIPSEPTFLVNAQKSHASPATITAIQNMFYLNASWINQYFHALGDLFNGTMGYSWVYGLPVSSIVWPAMWISIKIGIIAVFFSILFGIPLGLFMGRRDATYIDVMAAIATVVAFAVPTFVLGLIFVMINNALGLSSVFYYGNIYIYFIAALVIAIPTGFAYTRYLRSSVHHEYQQQYIALAKIKGLSERKLLFSHVVKPSLYPIANFFPFVVVFTLMGSITIETIFGIPGAGQLLVNSALSDDQTTLLALTVIYSIIIVIAFFFRDISLTIIDPRIRER